MPYEALLQHPKFSRQFVLVQICKPSVNENMRARNEKSISREVIQLIFTCSTIYSLPLKHVFVRSKIVRGEGKIYTIL